MRKIFNNFAFRTTMIYILAAGLWISSSDWLLGLLVTDPKLITQLSMSKGWFFIAVTASILYLQLVREMKLIEKQENKIRQLNSELEERVQARTNELQTAVQELEAFSYTVSHDLRAPLRLIDGFDRILQEDYAAQFDTKGMNTLQRIHEASQQMGKLIDALLQLSRVTRIELTLSDIDLTQMAKEIIEELFSERKEISWEIEENMVIHADPTLMRIVMVNLLGNAYKFTRDRENPHIQMGTDKRVNHTWIYIRDNGAGFKMENSDHLFEAFHRLHSGFEGTGIGLASVKRIINRHHGEIKAEAELEKGATFYFYV